MSVAEHEEDEPNLECACGNFKQEWQRRCDGCQADITDLYSDWDYQDSVEGK